MSGFHSDEKHDDVFAILFDSHGIKERFVNSTQNTIRHLTVKGREENRISAMLDSAGQLGASMLQSQHSAIGIIAMARTEREALLKEMGFIETVPQGLAICPACLNRTIAICEENLTVLKDLREAVKQYVSK